MLPDTGGLRLSVRIPGDPYSRMSGKSFRLKKGGIVHATHPRTREWRALVADAMQQEMAGRGLTTAALAVYIEAAFMRPRGEWRKLLPFRLTWAVKRGTGTDNIAKNVLDTGTGIIWVDDDQIADLRVRTVVLPQELPPYTFVHVREITAPPQLYGFATTLREGAHVSSDRFVLDPFGCYAEVRRAE